MQFIQLAVDTCPVASYFRHRNEPPGSVIINFLSRTLLHLYSNVQPKLWFLSTATSSQGAMERSAWCHQRSSGMRAARDIPWRQWDQRKRRLSLSQRVHATGRPNTTATLTRHSTLIRHVNKRVTVLQNFFKIIQNINIALESEENKHLLNLWFRFHRTRQCNKIYRRNC